MKRRNLNYLAAVLLALCGVVWIYSCFRVDTIGYGWTPRGKPDRMVVLECGCSGGQLRFEWLDAPAAYTNYVQSLIFARRVNLSGLHWRTVRGRYSMRWQSLWFDFFGANTTMPVDANGKLVTAAPATAPVVPSRQLPMSIHIGAVPLWLPILLLGAAPAWQLINLPARRRRNRFAAGQCVVCGYDLRASPNRCPECGAIPATVPYPPTPLQHVVSKWPIAVLAFAFSLLFAMALIGSAAACQLIFQDALHPHSGLMQNWTTFHSLAARVVLCAMAITCSGAISLLLFDGLRKLLPSSRPSSQSCS